MVGHTFLFDEGVWLARGKYYDHENNGYPFEGEAVISHSGEFWKNMGHMVVQAGEPFEIRNEYEIAAFKGDCAYWRSFNPVTGEMRGVFVVVEDMIISNYSTQEGEYSGVECLSMVNSNKYKGNGYFLHHGKRVSSWVVELTRA